MSLLLSTMLWAHADPRPTPNLERAQPITDEVVVARAGAQLDMSPELALGIRQGLELLYLRRYEDTRAHFVALESTHPETKMSKVADVLVWQSLMLENFDYKFEKQYWVASKEARKDLEAALKSPGNEAWEHFLFAGISGIESMHKARRGSYLGALQLAFEAMDHIETTRQLAPDYADLALADGMYNYWRTAITTESPVPLPDFGDHRVEGLAQMKTVETEGVFMGPLATLGLAFSYLEDKNKKEALKACHKNRRAYPDNVINNLVLGSLQVDVRRYPQAQKVFEEILEDSPRNKRARYWRGLSLHKQGKYDEAVTDYETYLGFGEGEDYQIAQAHYRIGQVREKQERWADAVVSYKTAQKTYKKHKGAKNRLEKLADRKKKGEIQY